MEFGVNDLISIWLGFGKMPLQKQHSGGDSGGADASSSGGIPSSKHHHRAKGLTGSISRGVSQKQQRAKETAAGKKALVDDVMTPQKLRHGGKKAGTISRGRGVVDRRTPSRPLSRSINQTQPDGEKNTEGKAPTLNKESTTDKNTIVHVMEGQDLQEADDEIQMLNDLGLGEDISSDEFLKYFEQLPTKPAVDIYTELDNEQLTALYERHARYRIRYLKVSSCFCIYLFINHQTSCIIYICVASVVYNVICDLFLYSCHKPTPWIS